MRYVSFLIIMLTPICIVMADPAMRIYHNERFHYDISYPESFSNLKKSLSTEGVSFKNKNMNFIVKGDNANIDLDSAYDRAIKELNDFKVISAEKKYNYFVITAENASQVLYIKSIFICDENIYFEWRYPKADSALWEPLLTQISQSFHYVLQECPSKTPANKS